MISKGVLAGAINADSVLFQMIGDSVILAKDCNHNPLTGAILKINHAINICGWGKTVQNGKNVDYWIIQNSWGSSWGNKGFGKVER